MCLSFYFNMFLLSLMVLILVFMSVKCFLGFGKNFTSMFIFLLLMVLFNFLCLFNKSILMFLSLLVFLSFYSMFLILYGYGTGFKVVVVVLFKGLADVLILLLVSNMIFLQLDCELDSFMFCSLSLGVFLLLMFFIYSLFGLFGFWLFWGMEASYFMSCFMHSCGFMAVGLIFFIKLSSLGVLSELDFFMSFVNVISLLSYLFFLLMFFMVKDCKKSFGFYSASSMCFLLFTSVNFPFLSVGYFFMSSVIKILMFEMLSYLNKVSQVKWFMFLLFVFNIFTYSLFFMTESYSSNCFMEVVFFMLICKVVSLLIFLFKVFSLLDFSFIVPNFGFMIFLLFGLIFNKFVYSLFFSSWLGNNLGYLFIFLFLIKFNFYSFKYFSNTWFFICNIFFMVVFVLLTLSIFYMNILTFNPTFLFKVLTNKSSCLNSSQFIFYSVSIPIIILLLM